MNPDYPAQWGTGDSFISPRLVQRRVPGAQPGAGFTDAIDRILV